MEGAPSSFGQDNETMNAMSISILLTYNLDNWSPGGWAHYLEGYTIYTSFRVFVVLLLQEFKTESDPW